jgi:hypothetical protein
MGSRPIVRQTDHLSLGNPEQQLRRAVEDGDVRCAMAAGRSCNVMSECFVLACRAGSV